MFHTERRTLQMQQTGTACHVQQTAEQQTGSGRTQIDQKRQTQKSPENRAFAETLQTYETSRALVVQGKRSRSKPSSKRDERYADKAQKSPAKPGFCRNASN